jgi:centromeric protein E
MQARASGTLSRASQLRPATAQRKASEHNPKLSSGSGTLDCAAEAEAKKSIQVCVRIRPLNSREKKLQGNDALAWHWEDDRITPAANANLALPQPSTQQSGTAVRRDPMQAGFTFDHLFHPLAPTSAIYERAVQGIVTAAMQGFHGTVFAYGQTSTGKSHTISGTAADPGIIPLAVEDCFAFVAVSADLNDCLMQTQCCVTNVIAMLCQQVLTQLAPLLMFFVAQASGDDREFLFQVSYLEIYNEQINDLLCPSSTYVRLVADKHDGVIVQGAKSEVVISPQQVYALISAGEAQRHVGATEANKNSSRSHTIFRMTVSCGTTHHHAACMLQHASSYASLRRCKMAAASVTVTSSTSFTAVDLYAEYSVS